MNKLREVAYSFCVHSGLARVISYFHRDRLAILCFHSISLKDENQFWPGVFISQPKLIELLDYLKTSHYSVISLQEAERFLKGEVTYDNPLVITIDDGWFSSVSELIPVISSYNFPCTLYVTTYYCDHQIPVVNVLLQYWLWQKPTQNISIEFEGETHCFSGEPQDVVKAVEQAMEGMGDQRKVAFLRCFARKIGVSDEAIDSRRFHNATYEELEQVLISPLVDVQLHTHTHKLPFDEASMDREVATNKRLLKRRLSPVNSLEHLCYPSGIWSPKHIPHLEEMGMATATTLDEGLNATSQHPLKLKRNLVMDSRSLPHFIVTISGILEVMRRSLRKLKRAN
ncbi:polysaccharide deacetylase family protein [Flexibacterium corallicola]|uniref:polysaccharide deacetylase family protein n=1 Tax=Flexibacterium corallicola TaxID=3037259 RepID=UPI00286F1916|nr:polysaccharide deacetylase family protein [Pseudovibrio sp. M1P-2-3]